MGGHPLYPLTLAMNTLQFSEISANCHEPMLRKKSHQMFIKEEFLNTTNLMGKIKKNFHHKFKMSHPVLLKAPLF